MARILFRGPRVREAQTIAPSIAARSYFILDESVCDIGRTQRANAFRRAHKHCQAKWIIMMAAHDYSCGLATEHYHIII